jgi:hypothetical protein
MHIMPMAQRLVVATGAAVALSVALTACDPTNLYVASNTVIGVNGAMNTDQATGHLIVGYDRRFAAVIPKSATIVDPETGEPVPTEHPEAREAMSVLSCSQLEVDIIFLTGFSEYLATGEAARRFAHEVSKRSVIKRDEAIGQFFDCYIPKERKPPATPPTLPTPTPAAAPATPAPAGTTTEGN